MKRIILIILCLTITAIAAGCSGAVKPQDALSLAASPSPKQTEAIEQASSMQTQIPLSKEQIKEAKIEEIIDSMTLRQKIGQLIITDYMYEQTNDESLKFMDDIQPGGIDLGRYNFVNIEQTRKLVDDLNNASEIPLIIACTEEGGRVTRTTFADIPATLLPSMYDIGSTGDTDLAYRAGKVLAAELLSLGVNLDFAPVADIWSNPLNTVIGDRSFGDAPELVAEMTAAMVRGMNEQGIGTTIKHFPGHGSTFEDSHTELTYCHSTLQQLYENDLLPFIAGIDAGADAVMTAHVIYPEISDTGEPATVSHFFLTELLRERLGFNGLIVTDSMHMLGMVNYCEIPTACVKAIGAGADLLLVTQGYLYDTYQRILIAVETGELSEERINESLCRILSFKYDHHLFDEDYELPDPYETLGAQEHTELVEYIQSLLPEKTE